MENPEGWDLLTACIAASRHDEPGVLYAFCRDQRVIAEIDEDALTRIIERERERVITGPSPASRIATELRAGGFAGPRSDNKDPRGARARRAFHAWQVTMMR